MHGKSGEFPINWRSEPALPAKGAPMKKTQEKEYCAECGDETEKAGEDSLYFGDTGPLCEGCFDNMESRFLPWKGGLKG